MAKFWEVIKAFQEGTADKAEYMNGVNRKIIVLKKGFGLSFCDDQENPFDGQGVRDDYLNGGWVIIENPAAKVHDYLMVVCRITEKEGGLFWSEHEIFQHCSLNDAIKRMEKEFNDSDVKLLSAAASNHNGVVTVLAYEGGMVE